MWWFLFSLFRLCGGFSLHSVVFDGSCVSVNYFDGGDEPSPPLENQRGGAPLKNESGDFHPFSFVVLSGGSPLLSPKYFLWLFLSLLSVVDTFLTFFLLWHFSP